MKQPLVYIILINWNGLKDTIECLESLSKINYKNYNIIVVDNCSINSESDRIKEEFPLIKLIRNSKNEGFCEANNQGIRLALKNNADYILLLNNDTVVQDNFLSILINVMEDNRHVGICSPSILYYKFNKIWSNGGFFYSFFGISKMIDKGRLYRESKFAKPNFVTGCAMLIRKEVIENVGFLDEDYFAYFEDVDYSFRAQKEGYKIKVIKNSIIYHKKSASAGIKGSNKITGEQAYLQTRNVVLFLKRHYKNKMTNFLVLPIIFLFNIYRLRESSNVKEIIRGLRHGLFGQ